MVHVEESLQVPRDFEGMVLPESLQVILMLIRTSFVQGLGKRAMMLNGQMALALPCLSSSTTKRVARETCWMAMGRVSHIYGRRVPQAAAVNIVT